MNADNYIPVPTISATPVLPEWTNDSVDVTIENKNRFVLNVKSKEQGFDLALRKHIVQINDSTELDGGSRKPEINEESLAKLKATGTALYKHKKDAYVINTNDVVIYNINVYNEGNISGYASEIVEYLPEGLEYISDNQINNENGWEVAQTDSNGRAIAIKTHKLENTLLEADENSNTIQKLAQGEISEVPHVQIACKVTKAIGEEDYYLTNRSEITAHKDINGNQYGKYYTEGVQENKDIDSTPDTINDSLDLENWYVNHVVNPENAYNTEELKNVKELYYQGTQDDDDFETVVLYADHPTTQSVEKIWNDNNNQDGVRPKSIQVQLLANNKKYEAEGITNPVTLNEENNWKYTWSNLPKKANGEDIVYTIEEIGEVAGYTVASTVEGNKTTIINTHKEYDLSLRKFITSVNSKEIVDRIPNVNIDDLINKKTTTAKYIHSKDPVSVYTNDIIKYTIRIYNEGTGDAYASIIRDDIPDGLELVEYEDGDGSINAKYNWKLLDENDNYTNDVNKAKYILTDYLSKDKNEKNLIKAFDANSMASLDYKDVEVEFKVTEPKTSNRIVTNYAQIVKETDEQGNGITDRDSTQGKSIEGEDDQDIEKIKVKYFDLALKNYVDEAIVIQNGEENVIKSNYKIENNDKEIVKVDIKKKNLSGLRVKFKYNIQVTNQGKVAGYAKEIKDYVPKGLSFEQAENPTWTKLDNGTIVTEALADKLLQPGESAEVTIILTWINSSTNIGLKSNIAEISEDYNEYETPDIDSIPNNMVLGEDDIDNADVMLTVKTGSAQIAYLIIALVFTSIIVIGGKIIKEKVMKD